MNAYSVAVSNWYGTLLCIYLVCTYQVVRYFCVPPPRDVNTTTTTYDQADPLCFFIAAISCAGNKIIVLTRGPIMRAV